MSWAIDLINNKESKKKLFGGIRNKRLLELCVLSYAFFYDEHMEPAKDIIKRVYDKGHFPNKIGVAFELQPSDVIGVLGCSERRAKEYVKTIRAISMA